MGLVGENLRDIKEEFPNCMANVRCGAYCGSGWKGILRECLAVYEACGVQVAQIKEKFGGIRVYYDGPEVWPSVWHRIACDLAERRAERQSFEICEQCGAPGTLQSPTGWYLTLCEACLSKRIEENRELVEEWNAKRARAKEKEEKAKNDPPKDP